jgi:hypothetical protein
MLACSKVGTRATPAQKPTSSSLHNFPEIWVAHPAKYIDGFALSPVFAGSMMSFTV